MHIFYTPDIEKEDYLLNEQESRHASKVLRLKPGDEVLLIDGVGHHYLAEITGQSGKRTLVGLKSKVAFERRSDHYLHIAIAPTKNMDRFEWFLEKATEIGVDEITPLLCQYSERKVIKAERLERVLIAAMKQSIKAFKPKLNPLTPMADFVSSVDAEGKYIAHCYEQDKAALKQACLNARHSIVMIGPEGDFSTEELALAERHGFIGVALGQERLRTETAGVVACHTVNLMTS